MVVMHRYVGLGLAAFLIAVGLTGSVLVWRQELDAWLNPSWFQVPVRDGPRYSDKQLARQIAERYPGVKIYEVEMPARLGQSARLIVAKWSQDAERNINEIFVDPVTLEVLGARSTVAPTLSRGEIIPWIYRFHYSLMLGHAGMLLLGGVAIVWLFDCFIGVYLTLPRGQDRWRKWLPAWLIKRSRANYDTHRASGLWLWPVLIVLAISSIYLNLTFQVFLPVLDALTSWLPRPWGDRIESAVVDWLYPLHTGKAFGMTGRVIVCFAGVIMAVLAVTGVAITIKKLARSRSSWAERGWRRWTGLVPGAAGVAMNRQRVREVPKIRSVDEARTLPHASRPIASEY